MLGGLATLAGCGRGKFNPLPDGVVVGVVDAELDGPVAVCASTYHPLANAPHLYSTYSDVPMTWAEAVTRCANDGAHLTIPEDRAEAVAVFEETVDAYYWIGVDDIAIADQFVDLLGASATYIHADKADPLHATWWWSPATEPNGSGDCLSFLRRGLDSGAHLDDVDCTMTRYALCECE